MRLKINDIKIGSRIRQNIGDITSLKESIRTIGLLQPIIVNKKKELISGFRRLESCRQLGWTDIEAKMIETEEDKLKELDVEYHENLGRLNLSPEEKQNYLETREKLLHPKTPLQKFFLWLKNLWDMLKALFSKE
ncbi:MAG: ParB N-terminal domain-containing protein [bacterium]